MRIILSTFAAASALLLAAGAHAADIVLEEIVPERFEMLPAVDGVNAKLSLGGYYADIDGFGDATNFYGDASVSTPLGQRFGAQLDGALIAGEDDFYLLGSGLHLFTRDPSRYLAGIYGEIVGFDGYDGGLYKVGLEGEAYINRFSVEAFAGVQGATEDGGDTDFNGDVKLAFYPLDNLRIAGGVAHAFDQTFVKADAEYGFQLQNGFLPAVFATTAFNDDFVTVKGGLRVYYGQKSKSLIERHRQDDPRNRIGDTIDSAIGLAADTVDEEDNVVVIPDPRPDPDI